MRFGIEYQLDDEGIVGLILFSAEDADEAMKYAVDLTFKYGFSGVGTLKPLLNGACIDELKRLFPGYTNGNGHTPM